MQYVPTDIQKLTREIGTLSSEIDRKLAFMEEQNAEFQATIEELESVILCNSLRISDIQGGLDRIKSKLNGFAEPARPTTPARANKARP